MIFLIAKMAIPGSALHYVAHIPEVVSHFKMHSREDADISLVDFLIAHLGEHDHTHADHHAHDNLPSHHQHSVEYSQTLSLYPNSCAVDFKNLTIAYSTALKVSTRDLSYTSSFHNSIWQPPKLG